jgi:hypothetical protein
MKRIKVMGIEVIVCTPFLTEAELYTPPHCQRSDRFQTRGEHHHREP